MKKHFTLPLLLILLIFSSCQNEEDTLPPFPSTVLGTWEMVGFNDYLKLDYVTSFQFNADGTYTYSSTLREKDSDLDLGFNFLERGTFTAGSEENLIRLARTDFLHKPYGAEKQFYSKEELDKGFVEPNSGYPLRFEIRDNGNTFFIPGGIEGGDVIVPDKFFERRK
ncbi:hypothetical protein [Cyclobacterium sp.]|uniref:hypothetical protein n=1 Tax=Cyclobacterium sp. TaxID=1966343 RepID=UPI0019B83B39|nr:hypothetical protein [Cyclobacterium sp.]MBD3627168.1 hypothetical protein [Cyclobacterium sp.]